MGKTFDATADLMTEGGIATHALRVVFYIDGEGDEVYQLAHEGAANLSQWLGNLELLKEDFIAELRGGRTEVTEMEED